jgi:hypothetical protein
LEARTEGSVESTKHTREVSWERRVVSKELERIQQAAASLITVGNRATSLAAIQAVSNPKQRRAKGDTPSLPPPTPP